MRPAVKIGWILLTAAGVAAAVVCVRNALGGDAGGCNVVAGETAASGAEEILPPADFPEIELDRLIAEEIEKVRELGGRRQIQMASPVSFTARIKRHPEEKPMTYIYTALEVAGIRPLPEVGHQLFVETAGGKIISVYVEKKAAARIAEEMAVEETVRLWGYHVYSYAKGPALLVVGAAPVADSGKAAAK